MQDKPRFARHVVLALLVIAWVAASAASIRQRELEWLRYIRIDVVWMQALLLAVGIYSAILVSVGTFSRSCRRPPAAPAEHFVSIVVPAKDEEAVIEATVRTLCALDYADESGRACYEVIVVDDHSTDQTAAILSRLAAELPLRAVQTPDGSVGKAAALNFGFAQARGDVVAVFDADARVASDFLRVMVPHLSGERVGGVQSRLLAYNGEQNEVTRKQDGEYRLFLHGVQQGRQLTGGMVMLIGNGLLLRRAAFDEVGGWNEEALTEDIDLSIRLHLAGWTVRYTQDAVVWQEAVPSLRQYIRQRSRWMEGGMLCLGEYLPSILFGRASLFRRLDMFLILAGGQIFALSLITTNLFGLPRLLGSLVLYLHLPDWFTKLVWLVGLAAALVSALKVSRWRPADAVKLLVRFSVFSLLTPLLAMLAAEQYVRRAFTGRFSWTKTAHGMSDAARRWVAAGSDDEA